MAEAPEPAEIDDTSETESPFVPFSGETFKETQTSSSTVFLSDDSGSQIIASQRKITYQTDTFFYQQTSEFFLSQPQAQPMGGLVGRFARLLGGNFREEPENMLQFDCVDANDSDDIPSRSSSGSSCKLSSETQRVSA